MSITSNPPDDIQYVTVPKQYEMTSSETSDRCTGPSWSVSNLVRFRQTFGFGLK